MPLERFRRCLTLWFVGLCHSWFDSQLWFLPLPASSRVQGVLNSSFLSWKFAVTLLILVALTESFLVATCSLILANQTALVLLVPGWAHNDVLYFVPVSFPMIPTVICFFGCHSKWILLLHYLKFVSVLMVMVNRGLKGRQRDDKSTFLNSLKNRLQTYAVCIHC